MKRVVAALLLAGGLAEGAAAQGLLQGQRTAAQAADTWLSVVRQAGRVALTGTVPNRVALTVIQTYAAAKFGADALELSLTELGETSPGAWTEIAIVAIDAVAETPEGAAELTDSALRVRGVVAEAEDAGRLTRALGARLPPGLRLSTLYEVPAPDLDADLVFSPARCAWLMTQVARQRRIVFPSGSVRLGEENAAALETIAELFGRCPSAEIEIVGYTDDRGDEQANLDLSQARAEAVLDALIRRGIPLRRLRARGLGPADPIADNATEAGRAANRRIEFEAVE